MAISESRRKRLREAIRKSYLKLRPFRQERLAAINQVAGFHYGEGATADRVPLPLLDMMVNIYLRNLAADRPRVMVRTPVSALRPFAGAVELGMNRLLDEMNLRRTLRRWGRDALLSIGFVKCGYTQNGLWYDQRGDEYLYEPRIFAETIDLDDWMHDTSAHTWEQTAYRANRYRVPLKWAKENGSFLKSARGELVATSKTDSDGVGDSMANEIGNPAHGDADEYQDYTELLDVYLPQENRMLTLSYRQDELEPLYDEKWDGPKDGPFYPLFFTELPANVMPLSPAMLMLDLHDAINHVCAKALRQAERQKTVLGYESGAEQDAVAVRDAKDGQIIKMRDPSKVREFKTGGADGGAIALTIQLRELFSYMGGNLDLMGGMGSRAETLGENRMLASSASRRMADMQDQMIASTRALVKALAWYRWHHPTRTDRIVRRTRYGGFESVQTFGPDNLQGVFDDYLFDIETYSMQHTSPSEKAAELREFFQGFVAPMMPLLAQRGITVDMEWLVKQYAHWRNMPELTEMLEFGQPLEAAMQSQQNGAPQNGARVGAPGASPNARDAAMMKALMGIGQQDSATAAIGG